MGAEVVADPRGVVAAQRLEPLDTRLARNTYLDAWGAAPPRSLRGGTGLTVRDLRATAERLSEWGYAAELLTPTQARTLEPLLAEIYDALEGGERLIEIA